MSSRKPYSKPQLEQVKLAIEEAVLKGCKGQTGAGPQTLNYCMNSTHGEINQACRGNTRS